MVNQPVLNQECDFSLGAERSHNEGTHRVWSRREGPVNPTEVPGSTHCLSRLCLYQTPSTTH